MGKQIEHVVRISCMGAETNTGCYNKDIHLTRKGAEIPLMLQHYWWAEKSLIDAGLPVTALRNNFFMNHLLKTEAENIGAIGSKEPGFFSSPLGDMRNSFVSTADIAEVAAKVVEDLSKALGKPVEYRPQSMEQFEKDFGPARAGIFEYLCNGFFSRVSPSFYNIVGRRPTTYYEYLTQKTPTGTTGLEELYEGNIWKKGHDAMAEASKMK